MGISARTRIGKRFAGHVNYVSDHFQRIPRLLMSAELDWADFVAYLSVVVLI